MQRCFCVSPAKISMRSSRFNPLSDTQTRCRQFRRLVLCGINRFSKRISGIQIAGILNVLRTPAAPAAAGQDMTFVMPAQII